MSKWMNEMKIDEISPFPISRLSLRFFNFKRTSLFNIIVDIVIIIYYYITYIYFKFVLNGYQNNLNGNQGN